jgi:signal recognition particle subunit SRP19
METRRDSIRVYPSYFEKKYSRAEGRKVPKSMAINDCTIEHLAKALKKVGIEYTLESDKAYPRHWWTREGRIKVARNGESKNHIIKKIALALKEIRSKDE